jgi:hypothetical protein
MPEFAVSGYAAIAQNKIDRTIASNFYPRLPFLAALQAFTLTRNKKTAGSIGRVGAEKKDLGAILSGREIGPIEVMNIPRGINGIQKRIQRFETDNTKEMSAYDTTAVVANASTLAHSQVGQAAALFYRNRIQTPCLVWHSDLERHMSGTGGDGTGLAESQCVQEATEVAYQEHVKKLNTLIWSGTPTTSTNDPWDQCHGINDVFSATNTYGNVDRSLAGNAAWRAVVDATTWTADIRKLLDDVKVTKNIRDLNATAPELCITTKANYLKFKSQIASQGASLGHVVKEGIPNTAQLGFHMEALNVDDTWIMYDATCPANTVRFFAMETFELHIFPGKNLTVSKFENLKGKSEGAKEANQAFIETEMVFLNNNPALNVTYTTVS